MTAPKRKRNVKVLLIVIASVLLGCFLMLAIPSIIYGRSISATAFSGILRVMGKEKIDSDEELADFLDKKKIQYEGDYSLPSSYKGKSSVNVYKYRGMEYFILNEQSSPKETIVYFHGGSFVDEIIEDHFELVDAICQGSGCMAIIPLYPLSFEMKADQVYELLVDWWKEINFSLALGNVTLMGDSAGGGMALSLALILKPTAYKHADRLILISPWVDVEMTTNPDLLKQYEKKDPVDLICTCQYLGKAWAGDLSLKDIRVSPVNGNMKGLCETYTFVGTRELLNPDIMRFQDKLREAGVTYTTFVGRGMNHDYVTWYKYGIKESKDGVKKIIAILKG